MKKNKMHKLDLLFMVGMGVIAIFSALVDILYVRVFPVYSIGSIYATYALWFIIVIYSTIKYKEKQEKPGCARWYMFFCLTFLHIAFVVPALIGVAMLVSLFR